MFDDDRVSTGTIADGNYRLITFTGKQGGERITVEATGSYTGAPVNIDLVLVINRAAGPATFRVNGRSMKARYDADAHTLTLRLRWPVERTLNIESKDLKLCSQE